MLTPLARIKPPKELVTDGVNLKRIPERPLFWHFPAYLERQREMKNVWRTSPASAVRFGDWKLIEFKDELYKLPDVWRKEINAPVPTEMNPEFDELKYQEYKAKLLNDISNEKPEKKKK